MSLPALRPRSTSSLRSASCPAIPGAAAWNHFAIGVGSPRLGMSASPPELVASRATPRTRPPNSSGCCAA